MILSEPEFKLAIEQLRHMSAMLSTIPEDEFEVFESRRETLMREICSWILKRPADPLSVFSVPRTRRAVVIEDQGGPIWRQSDPRDFWDWRGHVNMSQRKGPRE